MFSRLAMMLCMAKSERECSKITDTRVFWFGRILLVSASMLGGVSWLQAGELPPPQDHFHAVQACVNCHPANLDLANVVAKNNNSCLTCHTMAQLKEKLLRASIKSGPSSEKKVTEIRAELGMRYPLYEDTSRVGDEPNKMVNVPAGKFIRGTNSRMADEGPQHVVALDAFMIDLYEVTNSQYKRFIDATKRKSPDHFRNRTFPQGKADHPVTYVNWFDAEAYCAWAGKRLPTDAEWEKAARGMKGKEYPWGDNFEVANANMPLRWEKLGASGDTTPVGAFEKGASPYGVYDMTGNVWEWTASWYQPYPGNKVPSENFGERYKTLKGGSWFDCSFYKCGISAPVYNRAFFAQRTKNDTFGFRCAKSVSPAEAK